MDKIEIRTLLKHYCKQNCSASAAARKICEVEGEDVVISRIAQRWFQKYNPDLASSDYHLFRAMAYFHKGRIFSNVDEVERGCLDFFGSKNKEWYHRGIEQLADRWLKTIDSNGLYFEIS